MTDGGPNPSAPRRRFWFRWLAAAGVPLLLLLLAEGALRLAGYGYSTHFFQDREMGGQKVRIDNQDFGRQFFPPGLVRYPRPFTIPAVKPANSLRIFVLGESAAMGDPDYKFGLPRMLEVLLRERYPGRRIEVINAAMVAINSHLVLPIARECAGQQGDLWVVYMGNNEIIGPYGSASVFGAQAPNLSLVRAGLMVKGTRLGQLLDQVQHFIRAGNQPLPEWAGMEMMAEQKVRYDSPASTRVYQHFERNLTDMLSSGVRAGVPMVLCTVATNLKDCAPFASLHRPGLGVAELAEWLAAYDAGVAFQTKSNWAEAKGAFQRAARIDGEYADLLFRQAECCRLLGQSIEAANLFRQARDCDALQFRADVRINGAIRRAGTGFASQGVDLLDTEELFAVSSPQGVPGAELFYEHVHPTPEGNYLLARAVADRVVKVFTLDPGGNWVSLEECLRLLGFTDQSRYEALDVIRGRCQVPPFTTQVDHDRQLQMIEEQIARCRSGTKPAQVRRAVQRIAEVVARYPEDGDLRWNLAASLERAGDTAGALEQWQALIGLQPQAALPRINLAKLLESLGRQAEARQLYLEGLNITPEYFPARFALGSLCSQMGSIPEAIQHLSLAARQKPRSIETRLALSQAYIRANRRGEAEKQWREVLRLEPGNAQAQEQLKALGAAL